MGLGLRHVGVSMARGLKAWNRCIGVVQGGVMALRPQYQNHTGVIFLKTQRLPNPLIKEYTLNYNRNPNMI